jgi:hypothetical protein
MGHATRILCTRARTAGRNVVVVVFLQMENTQGLLSSRALHSFVVCAWLVKRNICVHNL